MMEIPTADRLRESMSGTTLHRVSGRVTGVTSHQIRVAGFSAPLGAACSILRASQSPVPAVVIGFDHDSPILSPLCLSEGIAAGDIVQLDTFEQRVAVGVHLIGRVVDAFANPIDETLQSDVSLDQSATSDAAMSNAAMSNAVARRVAIDPPPPGSLERVSIDRTMVTGIRGIDSMLTVGDGQRLGIFAAAGVGKSTLLGMLTRGCDADAIVIGLVGERGREVRDFLDHTLTPQGRQKATVVVATSDTAPTLRIRAAQTATAIAESYADSGRRVLLLIDSVTRFAMAAREVGLAAGEPPTTRGYPPSVFSMLPRLVERAGKTRRGSITAFYTVLVEGDDPNEPISDTMRGLLDGHIMLSRSLAAEGHYPAIDMLASLSRLQDRLLTPEQMQQVATVRRLMSEYERHRDLIDIGAYRNGSNPTLDLAIALRPALREFLTQSADQQVPMEQTLQELAMIQNAVEQHSANRPSQPSNVAAANASPQNPAGSP